MNQFLDHQISNMITMTKTFEQSCRMCALKNDGVIDKEEQKQLDKIMKATKRFVEDLKKIK